MPKEPQKHQGKTISEWAKELGMTEVGVRQRIKKGQPLTRETLPRGRTAKAQTGGEPIPEAVPPADAPVARSNEALVVELAMRLGLTILASNDSVIVLSRASA